MGRLHDFNADGYQVINLMSMDAGFLRQIPRQARRLHNPYRSLRTQHHARYGL
jgi:hypothetical protein